MVTPARSEHPRPDLRFYGRVVIKGLLLFVIANLLFAALDPLAGLGRLSAYNHLFPGRVRLPYGEHPERAYNLSLYNLDAMFASHELAAGPKAPGEFRVVIVGDSATWGFLLPPTETLAAQLNRAGLRLPDGRQVRAYNLGYPVMSLTKDLLVLRRALRYQPDLIVWPLTLESFPYDKQLFPPLLQHNAPAVRDLIAAYNLQLDPASPELIDPSFWDKTIVGRRRDLADLIRFQFYGILWSATGVDQDLPTDYDPPQADFSTDPGFHDLQPPHLKENDLAFDILEAGLQAAGSTPVLLVNEPVFISQGENSDLRYNFFYPRWAYDDYRVLMAERSQAMGWHYLDVWDLLPPEMFTNSAVHRNPAGEALFAGQVGQAIVEIGQP